MMQPTVPAPASDTVIAPPTLATVTDGTTSHFRVDDLTHDLKRRSVRGGATVLVSQAAKFVLTTLSTIVLARLLTPADYGMVGMVTVVTGFIAIFRDLGLSQATVQRAEISDRQVSTLFWINVAASMALAVITAALAPVVALFYGVPELTTITLALAPCFLLAGLSAQHHALLRRQMRLTVLAVIDIVSLAAAIVAALLSAWLGASYWALVAMNVTLAVSSSAMTWIFSGWRPGRPEKGAGIRSMVAFGGHLTGFNVLNYFTRNADNMLIGWWHGANVLGLYSRAYHLLLLPLHQLVQPLSNVVIPALSRLQTTPDRYRNYYRKALLPLAAVAIPLVFFSAVEARNVIYLMLGERWLRAAFIFQLLAPASLISSFYVATGWVYVSLGRADRQLRWALLSSLVTLVGFAVSLPWGPEAVAASFSIVTVLLRYPSIVYCFRGTPLTPSDVWEPLWRPAVASSAAGLAAWATRGFFVHQMPFAALITNGAVFAILYAATWAVLPRGWQTIRETVQLVSELGPGRRARSAL